MLTISPISPIYLPDVSPISPEVAELGCLFTDGALCLEAEVLFYLHACFHAPDPTPYRSPRP